jgi:hypothetical protein
MKQFIYTLAFIIFASNVNAQIQKGTTVVGIDLGYNTYTHSTGGVGTPTKTGFVAPSIAIAMKENRTTGIYFLYGHMSQSLTGNPEKETNSYGGGVFTRRYKPLGSRFYLFGQASLYVNSSRSTDDFTTYKNVTKFRTIGVNLAPGVSFAFSKTMQLELSLPNLLALSYTDFHYESNYGGSPTSSSIAGFNLYANVSPASNLSLGFRLFFGK